MLLGALVHVSGCRGIKSVAVVESSDFLNGKSCSRFGSGGSPSNEGKRFWRYYYRCSIGKVSNDWSIGSKCSGVASGF